MARPHPVVGLTTKLTYRGGRSGNHTHVAVYLIIEHIEFVSCIEGECAHFNARFTLQIALLQFLFCQFVEERGSQCIDFRHFACLYFSVDKVGDVYNAVHETEFQSRGGQFFTAVHGPETICQIIVFHAAVLLYGTVSAMVIGQNQSFRRDDFAGTATAEMHHGILQGNAVGIVNLVGGDEQSEFRHGYFVLLLQVGEHPHTFVGVCGKDRRCNE